MLDLTKPLHTVRGEKVRLLAVVPGIDFCIVGIIEGNNEVDTWLADGSLYEEANSTKDLRNTVEA